MNIRITCPACGKQYEIPRDRIGQEGKCSCGSVIAIEEPSADSPTGVGAMAPSPPPAGPTCPRCGGDVSVEASFCRSCGAQLKAVPEVQLAGAGKDPLAKIVPYRNPYALSAYYLGVFSLIPCLGMLLALASIPLGILGLKHAKAHPETHGKVHAWVGIVGGIVVLIAHAVFIAVVSRG